MGRRAARRGIARAGAAALAALLAVLLAPAGASAAAPGGWDAATGQPTAPFNATFFYGWYANPATDGVWRHWGDPSSPTVSHDAPTNWFSHYLPDYPAVGPSSAWFSRFLPGFPHPPTTRSPGTALYSSADPAVLDWQLQRLADAHQTVGLYSWWGHTPWPSGTPSDQGAIDATFAQTLAATTAPGSPYPHFRWAIYYEPEGYYDPSVATIEADLRYILDRYAGQPGYLKIGGKPVVFVYNAQDPGSGPDYWRSDLSRWSQARRDLAAAGTPFYISMKDDPLWHGAPASAMDSWHQYEPGRPTGTVPGQSTFVSPGFWREDAPPALVRSPTRFRSDVAAMAASAVPWRLTETWNEWQEGTSVEPGQQWNWASGTAPATPVPDGNYGSSYLSLLACLLPAPPAGTGSGYAPAPPRC